MSRAHDLATAALRALPAEPAHALANYVDPGQWAWAYMGIGDYDEAFNLLNDAVENPEFIRQYPFVRDVIQNFWFDPMLEQPEWVEARNKLRPIQ